MRHQSINELTCLYFLAHLVRVPKLFPRCHNDHISREMRPDARGYSIISTTWRSFCR